MQKSNNSEKQKVIFILAHQEDELFIASRIFYHLEKNDDIYMIWVSEENPNYGNNYLKRINESKKFAKTLGIPSDRLIFLGFPDGYLTDFAITVFEQLLEKIRTIEPDLIYTHTFEGGHIDHDQINVTLKYILNIFEINFKLIEFPAYASNGKLNSLPYRFRYFSDEKNVQVRKLSSQEYKKIKSLIKLFKSQSVLLNFFVHLLGGMKKTFGHEYLIDGSDQINISFGKNYIPAYENFLSGRNFKGFKKAIFRIDEIIRANIVS